MMPLATVFAGFYRSPSILRPFGLALAQRGFDVAIRALPGHAGEPPLEPVTFEALVDRCRAQAPERTSLIVGESLGGMVALRIAQTARSPLRTVIAIDPPLTMKKQVDIHAAFRPGMPNALRSYADLFGVTSSGPEERDYRWLLSQASGVAVHVIAGGQRPPRTVLHADDRALIRATEGVALHERPDTNHMVLECDPEGAAEAIAALARASPATPP
jgi:pimeloyl-ACP methyl ester carboxylesterase